MITQRHNIAVDVQKTNGTLSTQPFMNNKINILVIEDDTVISDFLHTGLKYEGYHVTESGTGNTGLEVLQQDKFNMVILDVMLPDIDGFDVCRRIRGRGSDIPILMLTVKKEVQDRVKGLDSGADD